MSVRFPHANNFQMPDKDFREAWALLHFLYPSPLSANTLPRLPNKNPMVTMEAAGQHLSLEYLCRNVVPTSYKNGMQATADFLAANPQIVQPTPANVVNPATGHPVQGVELIGSIEKNVAPDIEALFESDADQEVRTKRITTWNIEDLVRVEHDRNDASASTTSDGPLTREDIEDHLTGMMNGSHEFWNPTTGIPFIDEFVRSVHLEPFVPQYRGKPVHAPGVSVQGWDQRLDEYFWPSPSFTLRFNQQALAGIVAAAAVLVKAVTDGTPWSPAEEQQAVQWALAIFKWGGVRQDPETVTAVNVRKAMQAATTGTVPPNTPMNSGWTKVAAFASSHLGPHGAQVIWDSRVSTSIVRRLDRLLEKYQLPELPAIFSSIGLVNVGRGGTRPLDRSSLKYAWPNGYQSWSAQFAASHFVRQVCARLNDGLVSTKRQGRWTVRDVEMVLFGDGY